MKIFWSHTIEGERVSFDGIPFTVAAIHKLHCQFGNHYYKEHPSKSSRIKLQGTRKIGCPAHIHIHKLHLYPTFTASNDVVAGLGSRKLKELRAKKLGELREALTKNSKIDFQTKYFILLPEQKAHENFHPFNDGALFTEKVHPKVIQKIHDLVADGITAVQEVKKAVRHYVIHILAPETEIIPDEANRSYFPTTKDIQNHVYSAQKALELSKFDQENLSLKIKQWQKETPSSNYYFRPHKDTNPSVLEHEKIENLLYVHQEKWQAELLARYGNRIVLMDATYKTTKYELPLFFITVKTNVGYSIVADFVVQSETIELISEALRVLQSWNADFNPPCFMTDYSDAEIGAIESIFPNCKVFLCDFHREQAWERWVKERKHGLSNEDSSLLLGLLRKCAMAPPDFTSDEVDHKYHEAVKALKETEIWKSNKQVREWLQPTWLSIPQV